MSHEEKQVRIRGHQQNLHDLIDWLEYGRESGYVAARQSKEQEESWAEQLRQMMEAHDKFVALFQSREISRHEDDSAAKAESDTFWGQLITTHGDMDREKVLDELYDFGTLLKHYSRVLDHVTGGRISKLYTHASEIIAVADERIERLIDEEMEAVRK